MLFELTAILIWYTVFFILGLGGAILLTVLNFDTIKSFILGRVVGLLVFSYIVWLLSSLTILPFGFLYLWFLFFALSCILLVFSFKKIKLSKKTILTCAKYELVFLVPFIVMTLYMSFVPDITGGEKYMNFAIFNTLLNSKFLPPVDMWLSGYSLNYYYFGHLMYAIVTKMTTVQKEIAFSLSMSSVFAQVSLLAFYIGFSITNKVKYGLLTAYLILFAGNAYPLFKLFSDPGSSLNVIQDSVRFIPGATNDFPSYSFFLGGVHSHVFNLQAVLLFISLLFIFVSTSSDYKKFFVPIFSFLLGTMYITNVWDFIVYIFIVFWVYLIGFKLKQALLFFILTVCFSFFPFVLYHLQITSSAIYGIGYAGTPSGPLRIMAMFGVFIVILVPWILVQLKIVYKYRLSKLDPETLLVFLLALSGLFIVQMTEIFYIKDLLYIENFAERRTNTVYKFWYQSWILFSIAVPFVLSKLLTSGQRFYKSKLLFVMLVLSVSSVYPFYLFSAQYSTKIYNKDNIRFTLDGTAYLISEKPDISQGIKYLDTNIKAKSYTVIVEPPGDQYMDLHSVFSTYTGVPTVIGWIHHERVWRGSPDIIMERKFAVDRLYSTADLGLALQLIDDYNIDYIIVNEHAHEVYGDTAGDTIKKVSIPVFVTDTVQIYKTIRTFALTK